MTRVRRSGFSRCLRRSFPTLPADFSRPGLEAEVGAVRVPRRTERGPAGGRVRGSAVLPPVGRWLGQPHADVQTPRTHASRAHYPSPAESVNSKGEDALRALKRAMCEQGGEECSRRGTSTPWAHHRARLRNTTFGDTTSPEGRPSAGVTSRSAASATLLRSVPDRDPASCRETANRPFRRRNRLAGSRSSRNSEWRGGCWRGRRPTG